MSPSFARTDTSTLGQWWWTVDRWTVFALVGLLGVGAVLTLAASPPAAARIGIDHFYFVRHQMLYLPVAAAVMLGVSLLSPRGVRRLAAALFALALIATAITLLAAPDYQGATRWLSVAGFSVQPSEFLKPAFAVVTAWLLTAWRMQEGVPGNVLATVLAAIIAAMLAVQPDMGMLALMMATWGVQFFLAGLSLVWVLGLAGIAVVGAWLAYASLPHVAARVDAFLEPGSAGDGYQIGVALKAFQSGGLFGRGPGEGVVKADLPDAHADFIFAVAGEEFGLIVCAGIVLAYGLIVLRGFARMYDEPNLFVLLATTGLLTGFGLQALMNMASTLHLIPTKGTTLPLVSYGGSSLMAMAIAMGMVLALTRKRPAGGVL